MIMFNLGGPLSKALFSLYLRELMFGEIGMPEVSAGFDELRIRDPVLKAEFTFRGQLESLEPIIEFYVESANLYREPDIGPPFRLENRRIYFGTSHDPRNIGELVRGAFAFIYPRKHIKLLKELPGPKYYRWRFARPRKSYGYDVKFRSDEASIDVKCFSTRFSSVPREFSKFPIKRPVKADLLVLFDVYKDVLAFVENRGRYGIVLDVIELDVERPSISLYLRAFNESKRRLIDEILGTIEASKAKEF